MGTTYIKFINDNFFSAKYLFFYQKNNEYFFSSRNSLKKMNYNINNKSNKNELFKIKQFKTFKKINV